MSSINGTLAKHDTLRSIAFGSIDTSYVLVGTYLNNPARIITITNTTNIGLFISFDGVTDNCYIPANSPSRQINYGTNRGGSVSTLEQQAQTGVFVKRVGAAATSGAIFIEVIYAD